MALLVWILEAIPVKIRTVSAWEFALPEPLCCLDRLTLHSFVPELCVNLSVGEEGHQQASAVRAETVCANPSPRANIETVAPFYQKRKQGCQVLEATIASISM